MMEQTQRKLLLGVMALVGVGAGGYWFAIRESGVPAGAAGDNAVAAIERDSSPAAAAQLRQRPPVAAKGPVEGTQRMPREEPAVSPAKNRRTTSDRVVKENVKSPAS